VRLSFCLSGSAIALRTSEAGFWKDQLQQGRGAGSPSLESPSLSPLLWRLDERVLPPAWVLCSSDELSPLRGLH
jgi:hypothetical protein